ncbi:hypothetical protein KAI78_08780 [bacterium]|nr:hypothetical protein [bacterium]
MLKEIALGLLSDPDTLSFCGLLGKKGQLLKKTAYVLSPWDLELPSPYRSYNKQKNIKIIIVLFPHLFMDREGIIKLKNALVSVGGVIVLIDHFHRSLRNPVDFPNVTGENGSNIYEGVFTIENIRKDFNRLKFTLKKKDLKDGLWLVKLSNQVLLNVDRNADYDLTVYPFSSVMRSKESRLIMEMMQATGSEAVLFDGKPLTTGIKTYDLYGNAPHICCKKLLLAPHLLNAAKSEGKVKRALQNWPGNTIFIPVLDDDHIRTKMEFHVVSEVNEKIFVSTGIQKRDHGFIYQQEKDKDGMHGEYYILGIKKLRKIFNKKGTDTGICIPPFHIWRYE